MKSQKAIDSNIPINDSLSSLEMLSDTDEEDVEKAGIKNDGPKGSERVDYKQLSEKLEKELKELKTELKLKTLDFETKLADLGKEHEMHTKDLIEKHQKEVIYELT
jgi:hypothetical protein